MRSSLPSVVSGVKATSIYMYCFTPELGPSCPHRLPELGMDEDDEDAEDASLDIDVNVTDTAAGNASWYYQVGVAPLAFPLSQQNCIC